MKLEPHERLPDPYRDYTRLLWRWDQSEEGVGGRFKRCDARIVRYGDGEDKYGSHYWCGNIARWKWGGEQVLCDFHAGMVCAGVLPTGITKNGRWNKPLPKEPTDGAHAG